MVCMCLRRATVGLHTRVWLRDFSTAWDIGTDPLVCVQLIVYNKRMRALWPFGARESFLQAGQGPILRSTKRIQLTLDSSRLFGATWVKEIGNVSYNYAYLDWKCTLVFPSLASRLPVTVQKMVCSLQNSFLTQWHTMQGWRWKTLLTLCDKHISCFVAHSLSVLLFRNALYCRLEMKLLM